MEDVKSDYEITLYKMGSLNRVKKWSIQVYKSKAKVYERTLSGYVSCKMKESSKPTVGDAVKKAQTKAEKKRREGYVDTPEQAKEAGVTLAGMQAKFLSVEEAVVLAKTNNFICDFKYNGLRGTYHFDTDKIVSKGQKTYDVEHIAGQLYNLCVISGLRIIDFEFYAHGYKVNEIASMVKSVGNPDRQKLKAYIFDALAGPKDLRTAAERKHNLSYHLSVIKSLTNLFLVPYFIIKNSLQVRSLFDDALLSNYEGLVLRLAHGVYDWDNRTRRSLVMAKVKPLLSKEFLAVGCSFERRRVKNEWKDLIIYTCTTEDGKQFDVTPEGGVDSRCIQAPDFDSDSWYTVEFREYTVNGIPFHAVGKGFRISEDLDIDI